MDDSDSPLLNSVEDHPPDLSHPSTTSRTTPPLSPVVDITATLSENPATTGGESTNTAIDTLSSAPTNGAADINEGPCTTLTTPIHGSKPASVPQEASIADSTNVRMTQASEIEMPSTAKVSGESDWKKRLADRQKRFLVAAQDATPPSKEVESAADPILGSLKRFRENPDDTSDELRELSNRFAKAKKAYEQKKATGETTMTDDIELTRLKRDYDRQCKKAKQDLAMELEEMKEMDDELFVNDNGPSKQDTRERSDFLEDPRIHQHPTKNTDRLIGESIAPCSKSDARRSVSTTRRGKSARASSSKTAKPVGVSKKTKKSKPPTRKEREQARKGNNLMNLNNLLDQNIFRDIEQNQGIISQPSFISAKKPDALRELVASIPDEAQDLAKIDKKQMTDALRSFTPSLSIQPDPESDGWKLKGLEAKLTHYQMLGVSFMRERECSDVLPNGGILADSMGLGKTVMMIANIVNGWRIIKSKFQEPQPTLIVAPASLIKQWEKEIRKHMAATYKNMIKVAQYHSGNRHQISEDVPDTLASFGIVITTYNAVRRSYPKWQPSAELTTAEQKAAWWKEYYDANKGPLHRINWTRVVLDEAHAIKSPDSQTSIACRSLESKYRWAMSGTPVQNRLEEFYPYFRFLRVPNTGSLRVFRDNFSNCSEGAERLHLFLRQFMIRRTHKDSLLGAKLLPLQKASKQDYLVHFSGIERQIYDVLRNRFAKRINNILVRGEFRKKYSSILTMELRLRQVSAHPLLVQDSLRDLLEPEDFAHLRALCERPLAPHQEHDAILIHLRKMLSQKPKDLGIIDPQMSVSSGGGGLLGVSLDFSGIPSGQGSPESADLVDERDLASLGDKQGIHGETLSDLNAEQWPENDDDLSSDDLRESMETDFSQSTAANFEISKGKANESETSPMHNLPETHQMAAQMQDESSEAAEDRLTAALLKKDGGDNLGNATEQSADPRWLSSPAEAEVAREGSKDKVDAGGAFGRHDTYGAYIGHLEETSAAGELTMQIYCAGCKKIAKDPHETSCKHIYCNQCLQRMTFEAGRNNEECRCVKCNEEYHGSHGYVPYIPLRPVKPSDSRGSPDADATDFTSKVRLKKPKARPEDIVNKWIDANGHMLPSAKTLAFKAQVANWLQEDPSVKVIVYTQFISMIHILGKVCDMEKWGHVKFHGGLDINKRSKVVDEFDKPEKCVMLASLKTGGTGLNLTMACRVILIDLWWNTAVEDQAFCRVYRHGQVKETRLTRFIAAGSVDERITKMQEEKEANIGAVVDNDCWSKKKTSIKELLSLFGDVQSDPNGTPFIFVDEMSGPARARPPRFARADDDEDADMGDEA